MAVDQTLEELLRRDASRRSKRYAEALRPDLPAVQRRSFNQGPNHGPGQVAPRECVRAAMEPLPPDR